MITVLRILAIFGLCCSLHQTLAAVDATSIEVFVGREKVSHHESYLTVPTGTDTLGFLVKPKSLFARYKLEGLDEDWNTRIDTMFVRVVFFNPQGDQIRTDSFPISGRSSGWKGSVENSTFSRRVETVTLPSGTASMAFSTTTAGPASLVGVLAIKEVTLASLSNPGEKPKILMSDSPNLRGQKPPWKKSGTHPSMATRTKLGGGEDTSQVLVIADDDISAHADWTARIPIPSTVAPGSALEIRWEEAYSSGLGGDFTATYERLPPGKYRFLVEDLSLTGESLQSVTAVSLMVPRVFWKSFWFWGTTTLIVSLAGILIGRYLIRRRIRRHLDQERMISEERRRIALDLHDDIGTRVSHISLLASHADNTLQNEEAKQAFEKISSMSRDLIGAISETVWMLNSKNDDLESLVDFLYRLVNELCRLKKIRCRVDAVFITENQPISYEFRHNVSLAVKESVNNVLKHSKATELDMKIDLERNTLMITLTDNGIGISGESSSSGLGLENLTRRMKSIGGSCRFEHLTEGGLRILFTAPLTMTPKSRSQ